jgi:hypothetical protein
LPVEFLRENALQGNLFETISRAVAQLLQ